MDLYAGSAFNSTLSLSNSYNAAVNQQAAPFPLFLFKANKPRLTMSAHYDLPSLRSRFRPHRHCRHLYPPNLLRCANILLLPSLRNSPPGRPHLFYHPLLKRPLLTKTIFILHGPIPFPFFSNSFSYPSFPPFHL
jgi:hypothetical protein